MRLAVLVCALVCCAGAHAQQSRSVGGLISGQATSVVDGDTFRIGYDRIRLWGIDAPDWRARCTTKGEKWRPGRSATVALKGCLRDTTVTCRIQKVERHWPRDRYVAECWRDKDGEDVAACMVSSGWARDFPGYSGGHYAALEAEPKETRRGVWQCDGEPPTQRWCRGGACERPIYQPRGRDPT